MRRGGTSVGGLDVGNTTQHFDPLCHARAHAYAFCSAHFTEAFKSTQRAHNVWCWPRPHPPITQRSINTVAQQPTGSELSTKNAHTISPLGSFSASTKFPVGMMATLPPATATKSTQKVWRQPLTRARVCGAAWRGTPPTLRDTKSLGHTPTKTNAPTDFSLQTTPSQTLAPTLHSHVLSFDALWSKWAREELPPTPTDAPETCSSAWMLHKHC